MCGRYQLAGDWHEFVKHFDFVEEFATPTPRWNIAPCASAGYEAPIVTASGLVYARFWYIPKGWTSLRALPTSFNARSEELLNKSFFRGFELGLVPTSGWREFPGPRGKKRAVVFQKESLFAFGGIHTQWMDPEGGEMVRSFAILTTEPSDAVRPIHDRMPLIVPPDDYRAWSSPSAEFQALLPRAVQHTQTVPLEIYEASTTGNSTHIEGPACIARASIQQLELF